MVICLERGVDLHMARLMPLPLTISCFSKIQIGFTFLVPAHPGSPGKRAVKRVCVCVCVLWHCWLGVAKSIRPVKIWVSVDVVICLKRGADCLHDMVQLMPLLRYDTIRDAILTCARKPTWVSLIYRTETTTKNCKTEKKLKSKNRYARSNSKSLGNHVVSPEEEKGRLQCRPKTCNLLSHLNPDWFYLSGTGLPALSCIRGR